MRSDFFYFREIFVFLECVKNIYLGLSLIVFSGKFLDNGSLNTVKFISFSCLKVV